MTTCRVVKPEKADACGAEATHRIVFAPDDAHFTCHECALYLQQMAYEVHKIRLTVEPASTTV